MDLSKFSSLYLKALLLSYKEGVDEVINKFYLVSSEFRAIYDNFKELLEDRSFRSELMGILLSRGESPEEVAEYIVWRDFEYLVGKFFESLGYNVKMNIRIRGYRYEIDLVVVDFLGRYCLTVECKRWKRMLSPSQASRIAEDLIRKSRLLKSIEFTSCSYILPIIVTLRRGRFFIVGGVPVIPINFLGDFVENLILLVDEGAIKII